MEAGGGKQNSRGQMRRTEEDGRIDRRRRGHVKGKKTALGQR